MIKVTLFNGAIKFINPNHIISISPQHNGSSLIDTTIDHHGNSIHVKESAEEIMFLIKSNGISARDLEIIEDLKKEYQYGRVHEVSHAELSKAIQRINYLLSILGKSS